jgi:hypothetical protein
MDEYISLKLKRELVLQCRIENLSGNLFHNFYEKSTWFASSFLKLFFTLRRKFIFHLAFEKFFILFFPCATRTFVFKSDVEIPTALPLHLKLLGLWSLEVFWDGKWSFLYDHNRSRRTEFA